MEENDGRNGGGPSEKTERLLKVYALVVYFWDSVEGSPAERAEKTSEMLQRYFPGSDPFALSALSALKSHCTTHGLDASSYIDPELLKLLATRDNGKVSSPVTS